MTPEHSAGDRTGPLQPGPGLWRVRAVILSGDDNASSAGTLQRIGWLGF